MQNYLEKGKLVFSKLDFSTSEPLPNTTVEIYTEDDELIFTGVTDDNGKIEIDNLKTGRYYILEKYAPEGYKLNEEKMFFEIKENGEIVKCDMVDERIEIEVPNTGMNKIYILPILSCVLLAGGIGGKVYAKKKTKKARKR